MRCGDDIQIDPDQVPADHGTIPSIPPRRIGLCEHSAMNRRACSREFLLVLPRDFDRTGYRHRESVAVMVARAPMRHHIARRMPDGIAS